MTHKVDIKQYMNLYTFLCHMLNMCRLLLANYQKLLDLQLFFKIHLLCNPSLYLAQNGIIFDDN